MSGYRHCITENSADRQRQFEHALLACMTQKPLSQISVQDICSQVGLSRKSFYRYFSGKEACLTALVDHTILDYRSEPLPDRGIQAALTHYFRYWQRNRGLLEVLDRERLVDVFLERSIASVYEEHDFYRNISGRDTDLSQEKAVFLVSGLIGVLLSWHKGGYRIPPAQLAQSIRDLLPQYPNGVF